MQMLRVSVRRPHSSAIGEMLLREMFLVKYSQDLRRSLRLPLHYYCFDGPFMCLHLHRHALYFLKMDFHPCLYIYQVFLLFFPWVLEESGKPEKKLFCLVFCQSNPPESKAWGLSSQILCTFSYCSLHSFHVHVSPLSSH